MGMKIHWAWVVLASSFVTLFVNYSIRIGAYSLLLPKMIEDLQINLTQAGLIRGVYFFAYILFSPLMGWLTDRIGGRWVISFFCLFLGTGTFLMGRASNLHTAILYHGIMGIGAAAIWTPTITLIQKWFGTTRRGMALGILSPSYAMGFGLMGLILPLIIEYESWRMGWFFLGISGWGLVALNGLFLKNSPEEVGLHPWGDAGKTVLPHSPQKVNFRSWDLLRMPSFWLIGISYFFISIAAYMISDFIVVYGVMELKVNHAAASALITMMALSGIVGGMVLMWLSDSIGRKKVLIMIHSLVAVSILWILLAREDLYFLRIGMGGFGFLYGAIWPMYGALTRDFFPEEVAGVAFGMMTIFYGIGAMVNPILAGIIVDLTGSFRWAFGAGILTSLAAGLAAIFLKNPLEQAGH
ncbi:MAG: MFS transporter [Deltaproteobacteria bacterium]|nr:MFS transporter [Deltaproteobacteria bacterium]